MANQREVLLRTWMLNQESFQTSAKNTPTPPTTPHQTTACPVRHCVALLSPSLVCSPGQNDARTLKPFVCIFKSIFLKKDDGVGSQWNCHLFVINQILHRDLAAESFATGPGLKTRPVGPRTAHGKVCLAREPPASPRVCSELSSVLRGRSGFCLLTSAPVLDAEVTHVGTEVFFISFQS